VRAGRADFSIYQHTGDRASWVGDGRKIGGQGEGSRDPETKVSGARVTRRPHGSASSVR
jgi:hypothetical protein